MGKSSLPPGGSEGTPYVVYSLVGASAAAWPTANTGVFVKFQLEKARTATGLRIGVGAASGNAKAGIYRLDGSTLTQVALSASTALAGTNAPQDIPFASAVQLQAGVTYYAFLALDNATATIARGTLISGALTVPTTGFDLSGGTATVFTTPPASQALSAVVAISSGYTPAIALI